MSNTSDIQKSCGQLPQGQIPDGWEFRQLRKVCDFLDSYRIPLKDADRVKIRGEYPYYGASGIIDYINVFIFDEDLILLAEDGANIVNRSTPLAFLINGKVWVNNHAHVLRVHKDISRYYVCAYLESLNYEKYNTGTAQPKLNREVCESIPVLLPPEIEQIKIAEVLSTWDKAIELQTAIIDKLTLRKKGLMQQLLTGKKRLKGFSDVFNLSSLKGLIDEVSVRNGKLEGIPVLSVTNTRGFVSQLEQFDKEVASEDNSNYKIVYKGQFAYNPSRINVGSIDILRTFERGLLSPMYIVFKVNERKLSADYLCQQLKSWWFVGHISNYVQGSVRDSLSFDGLCSMKFFIPSIKEQNAIAEILTSADREIEKEKKKLEALKQQKKGLMQQLLTGKKRVIIN